MHEILNYLTWLNEIVKPYRDLIDVVSASVIAVFTIVLARVGWKQTKITRILQRAYLDAKFGGIKNNRAGELVGYVIFRNVGHLPAQKLSSLVILSTGGRDWKPPKTNRKDLGGKSVIPIGAEWPMGSTGISHPATDVRGLFLYVWGRVTYRDGFRWQKRHLDFCHRYPWEMRTTPSGGGVEIRTEYARYHEFGNNAN